MKTLMPMKLVYMFEQYESQHHVLIGKLPLNMKNVLQKKKGELSSL